MAYVPIRKYGDKDQLPSGDPGKVIYGAELDEEFDAISTNMVDSAIRGEVDDIYAEQIRQAVVIENHENRLDSLDSNAVRKDGSNVAQAADYNFPGRAYTVG